MPTSIVEEWLRVNKRKINGIYIEGDVVDLKHLLFHRNRDFLIKNNNDQVRAEHLEGKVVVLYFVSVTRRHRWMRKNIMYLLDIYTELVSLSRPFEIVLVAIMDERDDPIISEKIFQELFSIMPWTAIPFSDSETRRQLVKSFVGSKPTNYTDLSFVISETGVLLLENATGRMSLYGTEAYPFDKQSLQRVQFEDEEARVTPSLKNLLVSPQRDYVINNKGDKVSICDLEDKVVALFLYEEHRTSRLLTNTLRDAYKHWAEEKKMKFEVVLIYISVTTHTIDCTNAESFQKVFETMPWLAIPFNDRNCKKLLRVCNYPSELGLGPEPDPSLLIIGPHGEFFEPWGSTILMNFGIDAYPWNYDKVCMMQIEKVQKFNLNMLWDAETVFIREFGSKEVRFSEINVGKRIVVYSDYTMRDELYREFRMKLKKKYLERRGRDDEFEVIYLNLYYNNEEKFPWLRLQPGHEDYDRNVSAANDVFTHLLRNGIGILVFDVDGKIVRATSYPTFEEEDGDFPFYAGSVEDAVVDHINQLYKLDHQSIVNVPEKGARKHPRGDNIQIDTKDILFICGGAFIDLEKTISERRQDSSIGFGAPVRANMRASMIADAAVTSSLMENVESSDLIAYGLIPEFIGRFPILVSLSALTEDQLVQVLTEPKNALGKQYKKLFSINNVKLHYTQKALGLIARKAMVKNTGARGLRALLESILTDAMFEIPDVKTGNDKVDAVVIDEESVGSISSAGRGGKVLRGDGALEKYLAKTKLLDQMENVGTADRDQHEGESEVSSRAMNM